jgi:integral membrane sensor domain MASE1
MTNAVSFINNSCNMVRAVRQEQLQYSSSTLPSWASLVLTQFPQSSASVHFPCASVCVAAHHHRKAQHRQQSLLIVLALSAASYCVSTCTAYSILFTASLV